MWVAIAGCLGALGRMRPALVPGGSAVGASVARAPGGISLGRNQGELGADSTALGFRIGGTSHFLCKLALRGHTSSTCSVDTE